MVAVVWDSSYGVDYVFGCVVVYVAFRHTEVLALSSLTSLSELHLDGWVCEVSMTNNYACVYTALLDGWVCEVSACAMCKGLEQQ
jgi:hypothetical protein